ncbi:M28 family peptidase [Spartinivicinus poritis]|uniref:M28 family peptidase n=1 Tax=Spartinivicinus poritis TaxID=2994640 RepID=A0ABT5UGX6_9GAMM|nr:M28 family peptidase [Spartinivicinus sp. A2-2]MDE1465634.1 M28 family peptidase [Spartinivicinus sp. A2-2]
MNKLIKLFRNIIILLLLAISALWIALARPINFTQGSYAPEFIVKPQFLENHVQQLSQAFLPRNSDNPANLIKVAEYIKSNLNQSTDNVELQYFNVGNSRYANVLAYYGPESNETIVVGAHYDAYSVFPGADDNASGVAGLIVLGQLLGKTKLNTRIELVAYSLEEPPFFATPNMGSAIHAKNLKDKSKNIKIMISLEMIGYFNNEKGSQHYPSKLLELIYPDKGNFIAVVDEVFSNRAQGVKSAINRHTDLPAYSINAPLFIPGIDYSDHRNYWEQGYPAVMVTDTAFYRNLKYHTADDTYDRLDYERMAKVIYGVFKYLQEIDSQR